jgi:hypothetical protein
MTYTEKLVTSLPRVDAAGRWFKRQPARGYTWSDITPDSMTRMEAER